MERKFQDQGQLDLELEEWLSPNPPSVQTLAFRLQRRNRENVDSLLETTTLPNLDQAAPDLGINLPLGVVALTTS